MGLLVDSISNSTKVGDKPTMKGSFKISILLSSSMAASVGPLIHVELSFQVSCDRTRSKVDRRDQVRCVQGSSKLNGGLG